MSQSLPCDECKGKCCTFPVFSPDEWRRVEIAVGKPKGALVKEIFHMDSVDSLTPQGSQAVMVHNKNGDCPFLVAGKCSIYSMRPKVCKDYGVAKGLPCQFLFPEEAERLTKNRIAKFMMMRGV